MIFSRKVNVAILAVVFMVALVYAAPVEAKKTIRWDYVCIRVGSPTVAWMGPIYGEDMEGTLYWFNEWWWWSDEGDQHAGGVWWIDWENDGSIDIFGTHKIVADPTWHCNTNGRITAGPPDLMGRKMHTSSQIEIIDGVPTISGVLQIN
ncbi:MAG: hypothetical protein ACFFD9_07860 [Candidatus Thorarchaeota archaeon]